VDWRWKHREEIEAAEMEQDGFSETDPTAESTCTLLDALNV
jgi:hypothetical protein